MTNFAKQHQKLVGLQTKAEVVTTREEAQKILKAAAKVSEKLGQYNTPYYYKLG